MTRYLAAAAVGALVAVAAWVVWVAAHAPVEDAPPCCRSFRVPLPARVSGNVVNRRSPDHPVYHTTKEPQP